jgi:hypothetical protein
MLIESSLTIIEMHSYSLGRVLNKAIANKLLLERSTIEARPVIAYGKSQVPCANKEYGHYANHWIR